MGKVIIKFKDNHLESFKCKSKKRASEIAGKRPNVIEWNYYNDGERILNPKKKVLEKREITFEEMERLVSRL